MTKTLGSNIYFDCYIRNVTRMSNSMTGILCRDRDTKIFAWVQIADLLFKNDLPALCGSSIIECSHVMALLKLSKLLKR